MAITALQNLTLENQQRFRCCDLSLLGSVVVRVGVVLGVVVKIHAVAIAVLGVPVVVAVAMEVLVVPIRVLAVSVFKVVVYQ